MDGVQETLKSEDKNTCEANTLIPFIKYSKLL